MKQDFILEQFQNKQIKMWNPNTNYLAYIDHFKDILKYCINTKTNIISYDKWLELLNTNSSSSKIGSETHNICHGLRMIESNYNYHSQISSQDAIEITVPKDLLYQFYMDGLEYSDTFWNMVTNRFIGFYIKNNIFTLGEGLKHFQMLSLNLYICLLLDTNQATIDDLVTLVSFVKNQSTSSIKDKLQKVYSYDVCKDDANILEKLNFVENNSLTKFGKLFINILTYQSGGNRNMDLFYSKKRDNGGENRIFYGVPGCGKSKKIQKFLSTPDKNGKVIDQSNIINTVFHPEYSNSDFVGQIIPTINGKDVTYSFRPGPFTKALIKAYRSNEKVYLVIDEINRGNAEAIFGEFFQLLDREKEFDEKGKVNPKYGASEYSVSNPNLVEYLQNELLKDGIYIDESFEIKLPSNLSILATMNTSDQNVSTMDNAFIRRWNLEQVDNSILTDSDHYYKKYYVPRTDVTWEIFMTKVNDKILEGGIFTQTFEDKRLGKYFVSVDCLTKKANDLGKTKEAYNFAYKVLEYLWDNVCKSSREEWFDMTNNKIKTLEDLINCFVVSNDPLSIFKIDFH